jgi:hypothetical protein
MTTSKPTNPKDRLGTDKLPLHLWPTTATAVGSLGLLDGMLKYGRQNYREYGVCASVYVAACKRHLDAWYEGEDCAADSGVPHLGHALACLAILVDAQAVGKLIDDRSYKGEGYQKLVADLTPLVKALRERHADKVVHHWTIADNVTAPKTEAVGKSTAADAARSQSRYAVDRAGPTLSDLAKGADT